MTLRLGTIIGILFLAVAVLLRSPLHADLSINDIKPAAPPQVSSGHHLRHRPTPRRKGAPVALTVSQAAGAKYKTIKSALAAIAPGGTITIEPGDYVESVTLNKPVTLTIDPNAQPDSVIIESATSPALSMSTTTAAANGIDFRTSAATARAAVTVDISQGSLKMADCDIGPGANFALSIHGATATSTFKRCVIHDGNKGTLIVSDFAAPVLVDCKIIAVGSPIDGGIHAAVELDHGAAPKFFKCRITGSHGWDGNTSHFQSDAISMDTGSRGVFDHCDIGPAGESGVVAWGAAGHFTYCSFHDCGRDGATLERPSTYVFDHCDFGTCAYCGIAVDSCTATLIATTVHDCGHSGLGVSGTGSLVNASDSDFSDCSDHDIKLDSNSTLVALRCTIHDSSQRLAGILVEGSSTGTFNDCDSSAAGGSGIEERSGVIVVNGGKYHDTPFNAFDCWTNCKAKVSGAEIYNTGDGFCCGIGSVVDITNCKLHDILHNGIELHESAGSITDTQIIHAKDNGIEIWKGDHRIKNCAIDGSTIGFTLHDHGTLDMTGCAVTNCTQTSIDKDNDAATLAASAQAPLNTPGLIVGGQGFEIRKLTEGDVAFANRVYVWKNIPPSLDGWDFTRLRGGKTANITVKALRDETVTVATEMENPDLSDWQRVQGIQLGYTDNKDSTLKVYTRQLHAGDVATIPQEGWSGTMLLMPASATLAPTNATAVSTPN